LRKIGQLIPPHGTVSLSTDSSAARLDKLDLYRQDFVLISRNDACAFDGDEKFVKLQLPLNQQRLVLREEFGK